MKQDPAAQLTVIVPTYRRPRFLRRLLDYAETVRFPFKILVADSSDGDELRQNIARIPACSPHLHVEHLHFTCGLMEKLFCSEKGVTTSCCCLWADDDFQLPRGLISCLGYLEDHSDYVSCMGQFMAVRRNEDCTDISLETFPSCGESSTS